MSEKNKFLQALEEEDNYTLTENFAVTFRSTKSALLDFFAQGGAMRSAEEKRIIRHFAKSFSEDSLLALKCAFYFRDIRGGQGERRVFRTILEHLGNNYPKLTIKNMHNIPEFGRWDDLYALVGTKCEKEMFAFLQNQIKEDLEAERPSLCAKWLASEYTSSAATRKLARKTRLAFGMTHKDYRQMLSGLRRKIDVVERKMCAKEWDKIDYERVPSRAGLIYNKAFRRHDEERYEKYLESVEKGEAKIHAATLYPYDIVRKVHNEPKSVKECDLLWKNQPNWLEGTDEKAIVVCDTSGSMYGGYWGGRRSVAPIYVSVSLSIYFAERNKGAFHNKFITFSSAPRLQTIVGNNIYEKWSTTEKADWGGNTDLQAVFDLILSTAVKHKISQEDMPDKLYIISDMEFDSCSTFGAYTRDVSATNFETMKRKYASAGYEMPQLVFWNVESRHDNVPISKDERGVVLVSGCSPSIFKHIMGSIEELTPVDMMLEVLNSPRYDVITL